MKRHGPNQQEIKFETLNPSLVRLRKVRKQAVEQGHTRLIVVGILFTISFSILGARLVNLSQYGNDGNDRWRTVAAVSSAAPVVTRGEVVDRNGEVLAITLPTQSLYVDPTETRGAMSPQMAADELMTVLGDLNRSKLIKKIKGSGRFEWLARNLTPDEVWAVNSLGIPGFGFRKEERRVYPYGPSFAHILGYTNVDGQGIAGIEREFENTLGDDGGRVQLSIDLRVQSILHQELIMAQTKFKAQGAAGVVMDVNTGEIIALVSLPDFDPNQPGASLGDKRFNRATQGVYEMGSTFKLFTTAMALDTGTVSLRDGYDATQPIKISKFTIRDFHGKKRWLSVPEILKYSSNIGAAKMAMDVGGAQQKEYLSRLGLLNASDIELPEVGAPLYPKRWGDISTMTISYGHGIAVSPLNVTAGVAALVNGGVMQSATLIKVTDQTKPRGKRIIKKDTSLAMRALMRQVVRDGTGGKADVKGYLVGGKTGTANKKAKGGYDQNAVISSFVGVFPMIDPKYVVLVMLDDPKGNKDTFGYTTGGWVSAPSVGKIIQRMGPLLGVATDDVSTDDETQIDHPLFVPKAKKPGRLARLADGVNHAAY